MLYLKARNFLKQNNRGAFMTLTALLLPVFSCLVAFAIDVGMLYWERDRLQAIADAASLAGGQARYKISVEKDSYTPMELITYHNNKEDALEIVSKVRKYVEGNGLTVADAAANARNNDDGMNIDSKAIQYTNFTKDYYNTDYNKNVYDGPVIENIEENFDKVAIQCGIPIDHNDRVRVRLRKIVPTIMLDTVFGIKGVPVTVVAAAAPQKKPSNFRIVGMHGLYINCTDMVTSGVNTTTRQGYIEGDVYAGDMLSLTAVSNKNAYDNNAQMKNEADGYGRGYGSGVFTMKGNLYVRNITTGSVGEDNDLYFNLFARHKGEFLYQREIYNGSGELEDIEYQVESKINDNFDEWKHVYNFSRIMKWERCLYFDENVGDFIPVPPHKIRLGISTNKEKLAYKEATINVRKQRSEYRKEMQRLYAHEAIESLCRKRNADGSFMIGEDGKGVYDYSKNQKLSNRKTEWRYLSCSKNDNGINNTSITADDNGKTIKLLVEITGVPTTALKVADWNKNDGGMAWLTNGDIFTTKANLPDAIRTLNIETIVVVITGKTNGECGDLAWYKTMTGKKNPLTSGRDENGYPKSEGALTGTLLICPSKVSTYNSGYQEITIGDIYSEANLVFYGKNYNFNGLIYSDKGIFFPGDAYDNNNGVNAAHHVFSGSSTIFGNYVGFGTRYNPTSNNAQYGLMAGMDYPIFFYHQPVAATSGTGSERKNDYGIVPMHYMLTGMTDEQYYAQEFANEKDYDEVDDPENWEIIPYNGDYTYHWFNPNLDYTYMPTKTARKLAHSEEIYAHYKNSTSTTDTEYIPIKGPALMFERIKERINTLGLDNNILDFEDVNHDYNQMLTYNNRGTGNGDYDVLDPKSVSSRDNITGALNKRKNTSTRIDNLTFDVYLDSASDFKELLEKSNIGETEEKILKPIVSMNESGEKVWNIKCNDPVVDGNFKAWFKTRTVNPYSNGIGLLKNRKIRTSPEAAFELFHGYMNSAYPYFSGRILTYGVNDSSTWIEPVLTVTDPNEEGIANIHTYNYSNNNGAKDEYNFPSNTNYNNDKLSYYNDNFFYTIYGSGSYYGVPDSEGNWIDAREGYLPLSYNKAFAEKMGWSDFYNFNSAEGANNRVEPWFRCYNMFGEGRTGSFADANRAYLDVAILCGGYDPFVYRTDSSERERVNTLINGTITESKYRGDAADMKMYNAKDSLRNLGKAYRQSYDLDMWIKYSIDQINYFYQMSGSHSSRTYSDGGTARTYDYETGKADIFGATPKRYDVGNNYLTDEQKEQYEKDMAEKGWSSISASSNEVGKFARHVFGLKSDTAYASIKLVE